ncbi:hypothetical protein CPB83DRAFT_863154 [Crepidotus variabilis]|uniref:DUF6534 domain-containing protein n=1 Tax=Crepidotus variabilis TaxID=179855 RepID=A0A9P6JJH1_9AGAR|nr:hypothetical protein CPB83DRAFT_863154 [Crepidotus variabilis]
MSVIYSIFETNLRAGALVISAFFDWGLCGILILQVYLYYLAFPDDPGFAQIPVYVVLALELLQTAIASHDIFVGLALSFNHPDALDQIRLLWLSIPVFGGLTGGIGQGFFAYRIWMLTERQERKAPIIIGILGSASIISAFVSAWQFASVKTISNLINGEHLVGIGVWNGFGAICDIVIALSMPYYLMRHGTGMKATHLRIVGLLRLIIETGMFTAGVALLHFVLYFTRSTGFLVPGLTISKVYANTMLVILNNRMRIVNGRVAQEDHEQSNGSPTFASELRSQDESIRSQTVNARHRSKAVYLPENERRPMTAGTPTIVVLKDRLVVRIPEKERTSVSAPGSSSTRSRTENDSFSDLERGHSGQPHTVSFEPQILQGFNAELTPILHRNPKIGYNQVL